MIPVITVMGLQFAELLAGTIVVESVFYLPGLGRLIFQSISNRDLIVVRNCVMLLAAMVVIVNFVVDVLYAVIDPRVKAQQPMSSPLSVSAEVGRPRASAARERVLEARAAPSQLRAGRRAQPAAALRRLAVAGLDAAVAYEIDMAAKLRPPAAAHWLGTDPLGRDIVSLLLVGARASIVVGVIAVGIGLVFGTASGCSPPRATRLGRRAHHAAGRLRLRLSRHPLGHHAHGRVRPGHGQRHHRHRHLQHPDLCRASPAHRPTPSGRASSCWPRAPAARAASASRWSMCCPTSLPC